MGSFSALSAFKNIKANQFVKINSGHVISVEKYGWNFVQLSLCAYQKTFIMTKTDNYDDEDSVPLPLLIVDAKKGIDNFYKFFKKYSEQERWNNPLIVDKAKQYLLDVSKKFPIFAFDLREFFGMGDETDSDTFKKAYFDHFIQDSKKTITLDMNPSHYHMSIDLDEEFNLSWMIDDNQKRKDKWLVEWYLKEINHAT